MHDIGKIGVPDALLLKPGPLDPDERREIERHPEISSYILAELDMPAIVKQMVRSHHERYDGGGYPDGLAGEEIPLSARILTVADTLDAMTSDRPYRKAMPMVRALEVIEENSGTQFCPVVVAALRRCLLRDSRLADEDPPRGIHDAGERREHRTLTTSVHSGRTFHSRRYRVRPIAAAVAPLRVSCRRDQICPQHGRTSVPPVGAGAPASSSPSSWPWPSPSVSGPRRRTARCRRGRPARRWPRPTR